MNAVNEEDVVLKWSKAVSSISDISNNLIHMFKLKIGCRDWRETGMKTDAWKRRMMNMVLRVNCYERLYTDESKRHVTIVNK